MQTVTVGFFERLLPILSKGPLLPMLDLIAIDHYRCRSRINIAILGKHVLALFRPCKPRKDTRLDGRKVCHKKLFTILGHECCANTFHRNLDTAKCITHHLGIVTGTDFDSLAMRPL